jgi:hypothetical protein
MKKLNSGNVKQMNTPKSIEMKRRIKAILLFPIYIIAMLLVLSFSQMQFPQNTHPQSESTWTTYKFLVNNILKQKSVGDLESCIKYRTSMPADEAANISIDDCIALEKIRKDEQDKKDQHEYLEGLKTCFAYLNTLRSDDIRYVELRECVYSDSIQSSNFSKQVKAFTEGVKSSRASE